MSRFIVWITSTRLWGWFLLKIVPYLRLSMYYTKIRGWKYYRGYQKLEKGHVILTIDKKKLSSFIIGGKFSHAALCVDKGSEFEIAEMTQRHFTKSNFFDICKESDHVVIGKIKSWDPDYINAVVEKCLSFEQAKYDVRFSMDPTNELGIPQLACSELIYHSDFERRSEFNLDDVAGINRPYISPTGIFKSPHFEVVWDSNSEVRYGI